MILVICAAMIVMIMMITWLLVWKLKTPTIIDVAWVFTITLCSMIYLYLNSINEVNILYSVVISAWGLRLGFYLYYTRLKKGIRDKRYLVLSHQWDRPWLFYLLNTQFQGLLVFILTLTVYSLAFSRAEQLAWYDFFLSLAAILAIIYESIADEELFQFSRQFPGEVCDIGLWQYSRHPNYFFEWLFWFIIGVTAFLKSHHVFSFCAPLLLFIVMNYFTIPITESGSLKSRGEDYEHYLARTNRFFLWFPKSS